MTVIAVREEKELLMVEQVTVVEEVVELVTLGLMVVVVLERAGERRLVVI